jgi:hypothetical protein
MYSPTAYLNDNISTTMLLRRVVGKQLDVTPNNRRDIND